MIGPNQVGFGSFTAAGQVIRSNVPPNRIHADTQRQVGAPWDFRSRKPSGPRVARNLEYIGQLVALRAWYHSVRKPRIPSDDATSHLALTLDAATNVLDGCINERWTRLGQFLAATFLLSGYLRANALSRSNAPIPHLDWVRDLSSDQLKLGIHWLEEIASGFVAINEI